MQRFISMLMIVLLAGCTSATAPSTPEATPVVRFIEQATLTPQPTNPNQPNQIPLPDGWTSETWRNLIVPIPPNGKFAINDSVESRYPQSPLVEMAHVAFEKDLQAVPPHIERMTEGPFLWLMEYSGSLKDWVDAENQRPNIPQPAATILEERQIAGRDALIIMPAVVGLSGDFGYILLKADDQHILLIFSHTISSPMLKTWLEYLQFAP